MPERLKTDPNVTISCGAVTLGAPVFFTLCHHTVIMPILVSEQLTTKILKFCFKITKLDLNLTNLRL